MRGTVRPLALVTGASTGIGYELAKGCARGGFDLIVAADEPAIHNAAKDFEALGVAVEALEVDLATFEGVDTLCAAFGDQVPELLLANAGCGLGQSFLDQDPAGWRHVIDTNITGTLALVQNVGLRMRARRRGRILITGSIAGYMPGTYHAVYHGTKAFLNSFAFALRHELRGSGVTVTCLMPGATETPFFDRAGLRDTSIGKSRKDDPAEVARLGLEAMMRGDSQVVTGWKNKLQVALAAVSPGDLLAEITRRMDAPKARGKW